MVYKGPTERKDGNAVELLEEKQPLKTFWQEDYRGETKKQINKKINKSKTKKVTKKKELWCRDKTREKKKSKFS